MKSISFLSQVTNFKSDFNNHLGDFKNQWVYRGGQGYWHLNHQLLPFFVHPSYHMIFVWCDVGKITWNEFEMGHFH